MGKLLTSRRSSKALAIGTAFVIGGALAAFVVRGIAIARNSDQPVLAIIPGAIGFTAVVVVVLAALWIWYSDARKLVLNAPRLWHDKPWFITGIDARIADALYSYRTPDWESIKRPRHAAVVINDDAIDVYTSGNSLMATIPARELTACEAVSEQVWPQNINILRFEAHSPVIFAPYHPKWKMFGPLNSEELHALARALRSLLIGKG